MFFDMTTRKICEIIERGASTRLSDKAFLEKEISEWLTSRKRMNQIEGDGYYGYEQAILQKQRLVVGENGQLVPQTDLPNHKMIDNQYAGMVDQKVNYMLSKPITFKTENKSYSEALENIFNKSFHRLIKNVGKDSYNGGIGYIYPYYDENGEFKFRRFHPWEVKVFWKDDDKTEIDCFIRFYEVKGYEGNVKTIYHYIEVYDTNGIHRFEWKNGGLIPDYSTYHFETDTDGQTVEHNWERVPLVPFKANSVCTPLLKKCKSLQDGINQILSEFCDGMEENASGNSIIIIKNYDGENLGTFRRNLSQYKAVKVRTVDGADGGIDKLEINVNCENYKTVLAVLRRSLIENCKGYDTNDLKSAGSPNEMTIKSIFSEIDLDANELETEYQASFEQLMWFVNKHLANTGVGNFENEKLDVIFNRDMMVNESQIIADINASAAILSKKTLISMHPWIDDVDAELKQLETEKQEEIDDLQNMMFQKTPPESGFKGDENAIEGKSMQNE